MKKILIFVISLILIPTMTYALTEEEAIQEVNTFKEKYLSVDKDGSYYLEVNYIDPDIMIEHIADFCPISEDYEDYVSNFEDNLKYHQEHGETLQSKEEWQNEQIGYCKDEYYYYLFEAYIEKMGLYSDDIYFYLKEKNTASLSGLFTENGRHYTDSIDVKIIYNTDYDEKEMDKAFSKINLFKNNYTVDSLSYFNMAYHTEYEYPEDLLHYNQEIKKVLEAFDLNEIQIELAEHGEAVDGAEANYFITYFKNGIIYASKRITITARKRLYVDKDEPGNIKEKIKKRLKEYFNNKVEITDLVLEEDEENHDIMANMKLNGKNIYFVVLEVSKEELDDVIIESVDKNSGINVKTSSYDVPLDAKVTGQDVKDKKYVKDALNKNNLKVDIAFNITLSAYSNDTIINKIDRGIEVYIPVSDDYVVGSKHKVYYIKDDASIGETLEGEIVYLNNKKYLKFFTYHFSTYALANEIELNENSSNNNSMPNNQSNNTQTNQNEITPNTLDNINMFITLSLISLTSIFLLIKIIISKQEKITD